MPHFGAPSPASTITSSFSPALFLRRKPGGLFVFLGVEAGDALLEGRELDDDEAV